MLLNFRTLKRRLGKNQTKRRDTRVIALVEACLCNAPAAHLKNNERARVVLETGCVAQLTRATQGLETFSRSPPSPTNA